MISTQMRNLITVLEQAENGFVYTDFNNIENLQALKDEFNRLNAFVNSAQFLNEWKKIFNRINRIIDSQKLQAA